jgi:hypothetical protein
MQLNIQILKWHGAHVGSLQGLEGFEIGPREAAKTDAFEISREVGEFGRSSVRPAHGLKSSVIYNSNGASGYRSGQYATRG